MNDSKTCDLAKKGKLTSLLMGKDATHAQLFRDVRYVKL